MTSKKTPSRQPAAVPGNAGSERSPVPEPPRGRRLRAVDGLILIGVAFAVLVLVKGEAVRGAADQLQPGIQRSTLTTISHPTSWIAHKLPFSTVANRSLAWLSPHENVGKSPGFTAAQNSPNSGSIAPVTQDAFDPVALGEKPPPPRPLHTVLVTGDSMAMPLDVELARRLVGRGVTVVRDPHIGTGVSKTGLVDWAKLSNQQVQTKHPDATVIIIGANEGFSMPGANGRPVECCGREWAAIYAFRVRKMMDTYRQQGNAHVYWLTLPFPRDKLHQEVARAINAAIEVAGQPYRAQVRLVDLVQVFTPDAKYRDEMVVEGRTQSVRNPDGIHLNETGARVTAGLTLAALQRDFKW